MKFHIFAIVLAGAALATVNANADTEPEEKAADPGTNCIKIGLPGKLILSKRKGLREVIFS